jgi:hypothetical protein
MINIDEIKNKINQLSTNGDSNSFSLFRQSNFLYIGINNNSLVFVTPCNEPVKPTYFQETKELRLGVNVYCSLQINGKETNEHCNILYCLSHDTFHVDAFVRLGLVFFEKEKTTDEIVKLFSSLTNMFSKNVELSFNEIQGFYGELFTIYFLNQKGISIAKYWQSEDRMKFDFSIDEKKRIEVKTTIKEERIHHFRHEQLLSDFYDIKVVSILLRKSDTGLSLNELIESVRAIPSIEFAVIEHIEKFINQASNKQQVLSICFDETYAKQNIKFFSADRIPRFNEKQPNGVTNTEYDVDLSTTKTDDLEILKSWLQR